MVLLGGLEIVVGGYFIHRYHKKQSEKKRLEDEARERRHNTFPGAKPQNVPHQQQQQMIHQQKYACYGQPQPQPQPRPHMAQTFPQTRPQPSHFHSQPALVPPSQPDFQPLHRSDSIYTISNMPVANGSRPHDAHPHLPPRPAPQHLQPIPQQQALDHPYSNAGFSVSVPSFHPSAMPYTPTTGAFGRNTVDDNWEIYGSQSPRVHFDVPGSPQTGEREDDPPPPYRP